MSRTDRASLLIHVPREDVFAALTSEAALLAWLPPKGMQARFERFDLRTGGSYRLVLTYDDASDSPGKSSPDSDVSEVRIPRVDPGERVVQEVDFESDDPTMQGTMQMEWQLLSVDEGTIVEIVARNVPAGIRARDHAEGITSSLSNLAAYLEPDVAVAEEDEGIETVEFASLDDLLDHLSGPRPKVPRLSIERIADAAIELVDSGEAFGVKALARHLGVTRASLHNHVDGRDGIIEVMRGRLGEQYLAVPPQGTWDEVVAQTIRASRRMYAEHPFVVPLIVGTTITHPLVIASYDHLATALLDAGFPDDEVLVVVAILDAFAIGFGLDLAAPDQIWRPEVPTVNLERLLSDAETGDERSDRAFEIGLELLLDALRMRLGRLDLD